MYQHIIIESGAKVYQKNSQLFIEAEQVHHIPIEDIATLLLDNRRIAITGYCLETIVKNGAVVILCNEKHLPSAVMLPFAANSRRLKMINLQIEQTKPRKKQLWKQIIQQKIYNQGRCLELCGKENIVKRFIDKVKSGDSTNAEGSAAAVYFKALYGDDFIRHSGDVVNSILDYGYAVLRGSIARYLALYGFEPSLGMFHHNELNSFNLADDLIESFRPIVDIYAYRHVGTEEKEMSATVRRELVQLLSCNVCSGNEVHAVHYAIERTVQSLIRAYTEKEKCLLLPELLPLQVHAYE